MQRFLECRRRAGLTAQAAAEKLGVSISSVYLWETGKRFPNGRTIRDMAILYNCSADELLDLKK